MIGRVDDWLAELFAPDVIDATLGQLAEQAAQFQDPAVLTRAEAEIRAATGQRQMTPDDIAAIVGALADLARVVHNADPADKAEIYTQLGLTLTCQPGRRVVEATIKPGLEVRKGFVSEGRTGPALAMTGKPRSGGRLTAGSIRSA